MCGILGIWRETGITNSDISRIITLIAQNSDRGTLSYGLISPTHFETNLINPKVEDFTYLNKFIGEKYLLVHLRSPTGNGKVNLYVTQPLIDENSALLFNGILTKWDQGYPTDTFYMFDKIKGHGLIAALELLRGSYAIAYLKNNRLFLARCINSLYYDDNFFSSTPFENCKELKHGELLDFDNKKITKLNVYTPYDI
jgi:asparagine synthetase B (glutamine-hydrolysing)